MCLEFVSEKGAILIYQPLSTKYWNAILIIVNLDKDTAIQNDCGRRCALT